MIDYRDEQYNSYTDIATVTLMMYSGDGGITYTAIPVKCDGLIKVYAVNDISLIPEYYKHIYNINGLVWFKLYDDNELIITDRASKLDVYRAGNSIILCY